MKKFIAATAIVVSAGAAFAGCSYGGIATAGDKVVVTRNDNFLYGMLRAIYVCKVTDEGLTSCVAGEQEQ